MIFSALEFLFGGEVLELRLDVSDAVFHLGGLGNVSQFLGVRERGYRNPFFVVLQIAVHKDHALV